MILTEKPEIVTWPKTHYVYVEKIGPLQETAADAWLEFHRFLPIIAEQGKIIARMSLYKADGKKATYRAGVGLSALPAASPKGLSYEKFQGGKYYRFVLKGPYANLPLASGRVFDIVNEENIACRNDFCIEHYVNDPKTTSEDRLITEILIPAA